MKSSFVPDEADSIRYDSITLEVDKLESYDSFSYKIPGIEDYVVVPNHVYELLMNLQLPLGQYCPETLGKQC